MYNRFMREERGTVKHDVTVSETYTLWGAIVGKVTVVDGGKFYVRGAVYGDIEVLSGGRMHIFGSVSGKVTLARGTKVIHSGIIGGDVINDGGRFFKDADAKIAGKVRTNAGETQTL